MYARFNTGLQSELGMAFAPSSSLERHLSNETTIEETRSFLFFSPGAFECAMTTGLGKPQVSDACHSSMTRRFGPNIPLTRSSSTLLLLLLLLLCEETKCRFQDRFPIPHPGSGCRGGVACPFAHTSIWQGRKKVPSTNILCRRPCNLM